MTQPSYLSPEQAQAWARLRIVAEQQKAMYGLLFHDYSSPSPEVASNALSQLVDLQNQTPGLTEGLLEAVRQELAR